MLTDDLITSRLMLPSPRVAWGPLCVALWADEARGR